MLNNISYIIGDAGILDDVKELWEGLNEHHRKRALHFADYYSKFIFEKRKEDLIKKSQKGRMRIEIAVDETYKNHVGYCISTIDDEGTGEIESIFILDSYRGTGIGEELMKRALKWMDEMRVIKKIVTVAAGNENAFGFYEKFGFYPRKTLLEQIKEDK